MEAEGISKFWKTKVMTNSPATSTVQMEAMDSSRVSSRGVPVSSGRGGFFGKRSLLNCIESVSRERVTM